MKMLQVLAPLIFVFCHGVNGHDYPLNAAIPKIEFEPTELRGVEEDKVKNATFRIVWENSTDLVLIERPQKYQGDFRVTLSSANRDLLEIEDLFFPDCIRADVAHQNYTFSVKGKFLGYTHVLADLSVHQKGCSTPHPFAHSLGEEEQSRIQYKLLVSIVRQYTPWIDIITGVFTILVAFNFVNMGVQLDIPSIIEVLKKPIGPVIGFICQFAFMPVVAFAISMLLFEDASQRLGIFTLGCCPGGSMSNFWTLLFDGDVNLSVTMTFISSIAALAMMPFWIYTLGSLLFQERKANIPYSTLAGSLIVLTLPMIGGMLIRRYSPRLTRISEKIIRPFTIIIVLSGITMACYINRYIFSLFTWNIVLAGVCISWGGYTFGAVAAWLCRLKKPQIIAISIETAFQNAAIAFVLLLLSLSQPDSDLSSVPVVAQLMLTGIPMWILLICTRIYRKCKAREDDGKVIETPKIDTVQRAYSVVETEAPDEKDEKDFELKSLWT